MTSSATSFYVTGGTLRHDAPSYVERRADRDLYDALVGGEFCYVLTARQMGKSSLMVRTAARLREAGVAVAVLDLTAIGQNLSPEQWYDGLLRTLGWRLDCEDALEEFWLANARMGPLQRWFAALREVLLTRAVSRQPDSAISHQPSAISEGEAWPSTDGCRLTADGSNVVIFIDEIDTVQGMPFSTDEFFAAIRECYNRRTEDPAFQRLTFCLLGVATPSDLIQDTRTTPFNIGRRIELTDFTASEAAPLAMGLREGLATEGTESTEEECRKVLQRVLYWTNGHPYLTQRLCRSLADASSVATSTDPAPPSAVCSVPSVARLPSQRVDRLCEALFLSPSAQERDDNLLFVRERLLRSGVDLAALLDLYSRVRAGKRIGVDDTNPLIDLLRLSGVARVADGRLEVRNRIYERVFDRAWVTAHMPDAELRRQRAAYRRGLLRASAIASVMVTGMAGLAFTATRAQRVAEERLVRLHVATGMGLVSAGDWFGSLPWLVEALRRDEGDPAREAVARIRLHAVFRHCPRLTQIWFHPGWVRDGAFSPDGRRVVTACSDGRARVWDTATGRMVTDAMKHGGSVLRAAFSPDGRRVLTASEDGAARVWDAVTGEPVTPPLRHREALIAAVFSPEGRRVATAGWDDTARIWDAATGRPLTKPIRHSADVTAVAFSPDGKRLVTNSRVEIARVWDTATGKPLLTLRDQIDHPGHDYKEATASFSPDGRRVATTLGGGRVAIWDAATGRRLTPPLQHEGHLVEHAVFSPDGRRVATTEDILARVWDVVTGQPRTSPLRHRRSLEWIEFSPNGGLVVTAGSDRTVRLWDAETGEPKGPPLLHNDGVFRARFSPDGRLLLTASRDGTARIWEVASGRPDRLISRLKVATVAFSPDGRRLLTAGFPGSTRVWDLGSARPLSPPFVAHGWSDVAAVFPRAGPRVASMSRDWKIRVWNCDTGQPLTPPLRLEAPGWVPDHLFSPDGHYLAVSVWGNVVRVWEVDTGRLCLRLSRQQREVVDVDFSPDSRRILTAGTDGTARIWELATGRSLAGPMRHAKGIRSACFSPDGLRVATAGADGAARIWEASTGRPISPPMPHRLSVAYVAFSPDSRRAVTTSAEAARVWDAVTGQPITPPLPHDGMVERASFSPDGRLVVSASWDHHVQVWDAATGEPVTPPLWHPSGQVHSALFSPDGQRIISLPESSPACIWELPRDDRPVADWDLVAQLLAGQRLNDRGEPVFADSAAIRRAWERLRSRYPHEFWRDPEHPRAKP